MRTFRFRLRSLVIGVAVLAALMAGASLAWRWARLRPRYLALAETYRMNAGSCRATLANGTDRRNAAYYAWAADEFARRERAYRHAAAHPWGAVPPEE